MKAKKQIIEIVKSLSNEDAEKLLELINQKIELVATDYDRKAIERGREEIKNGEYEAF